ncbi:MAG: response regulator [Chloroflexi bacterium]|nr:response regulator [Chloroflexota bacterium]
MSTAGRVLVVDDDESIREFITLALASEGYEVVAAPHGAAALRLVDKCQPSLILLDLLMPVMDGWEFSRAYHQTPGPHTPIILLTASRGAVESATEMNAAAFLAKPFDLNDLLDLVNHFANGG